MSHNNHKGGAAIYVITAIILAIITYIEFALIQFNWLANSNATLFTLVALSIIKFLMVISIFMHLKDDSKTLSGFFAAGLVFAFATFIVMIVMFTVDSTANQIASSVPSSHDSQNLDLVKEAGFSFPSGPENQAYIIEKPLDTEQDYSFSLANSNSAINKSEENINATTEILASDFDWKEVGEQTFSNCIACHQTSGNGIPGAFPPLNRNAAKLYNADREYLIKVVSFGLSGEITVDGSSYNGAMPAWQHFSNSEIAAVLNYVLSSWDNPSNLADFKAYSPAEVANIRSLDLSSAETLKLRP